MADVGKVRKRLAGFDFDRGRFLVAYVCFQDSE
jgi:hypothetical protein